jgi:hypothetical protein
VASQATVAPLDARRGSAGSPSSGPVPRWLIMAEELGFASTTQTRTVDVASQQSVVCNRP